MGRRYLGILRGHRQARDISRLASMLRIDEKNHAGAAGSFGEVRRQLFPSANFYIFRGQQLAQLFGDMPAEAVIAPQRIAIADDQNVRHDSTSTRGGKFRPQSRRSVSAIGCAMPSAPP